MPPADTLALLQRRFFQLITAPEGVEKGLAALGLPRAEVEAAITGDGRASAIERLDVYAGMYFFRIRDVLRDYFPKLAAVLGDAAFHNLAVDYLIAHPSRHPSLRHVGDALPAFVGGHALASDRPWLADLAALEHARLDVFDRADSAVQTRQALAALPPEAFADLPLALIPAHQLVPVQHAVDRIWRTVELMGTLEGSPNPPAPGSRKQSSRSPTRSGEPVPEPPPAAPGGTLLVWRRGVTVYHRAVDPREAEALAAARDGLPFGALCAQLGRDGDATEAAQRAAALLARWVADELLAG